jgi:hypothetical protein
VRVYPWRTWREMEANSNLHPSPGPWLQREMASRVPGNPITARSFLVCFSVCMAFWYSPRLTRHSHNAMGTSKNASIVLGSQVLHHPTTRLPSHLPGVSPLRVCRAHMQGVYDRSYKSCASAKMWKSAWLIFEPSCGATFDLQDVDAVIHSFFSLCRYRNGTELCHSFVYCFDRTCCRDCRIGRHRGQCPAIRLGDRPADG